MDNGASSYRRYLNGDQSGFVDIVKEYKDGLVFYLNSFVNDLVVAEELTEDTFVRLGIKKPHFGAKSSFKTWLYKIGHNIAIDYLRKQVAHSTIPIEECEIAIDNPYFDNERKIILNSAMTKLKDEYRQVLWLVYFEGFSNKEVAKIMHKGVHNIETLSYRAKQSLRDELIKEGYTYEEL